MLRQFERQLLEESWEKVVTGVEVKLCPSPQGVDETFVLCRSVGRKEKRECHFESLCQQLGDSAS